MKKLTAPLLILLCLLFLAGCAAGSTEEAETVVFHGRTFQSSDLSKETLQWLERYNSLTEEEQLAISYIPADLYQLWGYNNAEDAPAEAG